MLEFLVCDKEASRTDLTEWPYILSHIKGSPWSPFIQPLPLKWTVALNSSHSSPDAPLSFPWPPTLSFLFRGLLLCLRRALIWRQVNLFHAYIFVVLITILFFNNNLYLLYVALSTDLFFIMITTKITKPKRFSLWCEDLYFYSASLDNYPGSFRSFYTDLGGPTCDRQHICLGKTATETGRDCSKFVLQASGRGRVNFSATSF